MSLARVDRYLKQVVRPVLAADPATSAIARSLYDFEKIGRSVPNVGGFKVPFGGKRTGAWQRSVIVAGYRTRWASSWAFEGFYLQRREASIDGQIQLGFSQSRADIEIMSTLGQWQSEKDPRMFQLILSPEFGEKIDLVEHTKKVMQRFEDRMGEPLEWVGVVHHNTDNPHAHVALRGISEEGTRIFLSKADLFAMRFDSRELATNELGLRTAQMVAQARDRILYANRWTDVDADIVKQLDEHQQIDVSELDWSRESARLSGQVVARLNHLGRLNLAEEIQGGQIWKVEPEAKNVLKALQLNGDAMKRKSNHLSQLSDPSAPFEIHTGGVRREVIGRYIGQGMHEELSNNRYIIVEGGDGSNHYVEVGGNIDWQVGKGRVRPGDIVRVTSADPSTNYGRFVDVRTPSLGLKIRSDYALTGAANMLADSRELPKRFDAPNTFAQKFHNLRVAAAELLIEKGLAIPKGEGGFEVRRDRVDGWAELARQHHTRAVFERGADAQQPER